MRTHRLVLLFLPVAWAGGAVGAAAQDCLQLTDGRFVSGPKMTRKADGVTIHLDSGDVVVPKSMVKVASVSATDAGAEEADTPEAIKNKEKGLVEFEGKWIRPDARDALLAKRNGLMQGRIAEAMAHSEWRNAYQTESKYFKFEYTIDPEIMKYWADLMDGYASNFMSFWRVRQSPTFGKLHVMFHHNPEKFYELTGMPEGVGGFFRFVPPLELQFYFDRLDTDWTMNVMFHEANHYLLWLVDPHFRYPPWLNEGLAEYYGASVWNEKSKKLDVGGLLEGRVAQVQQDIIEDKWVTLQELTTQPHPIGGEYYGWAWTFVHFMLNSKYKEAFRKFVIGLPKDGSLKTTRESFGEWSMEFAPPDQVQNSLKRNLRVSDLTALDKEWHGYIKNLKPSSGRGYFTFGRTALGNGMPIKAKRMFEIALEKGYESPQVFSYYARALTRVPAKNREEHEKNLEEAKTQYEKVLAMDPISPLDRVEYARLLNQLAKLRRKADPEVTKQIDLAKALGRCVEGGMWDYDVFLSTSLLKPYEDGTADDGK
ncbi:MAG: hypothetical protein R3F56_06355 [Planctomycetota bacterium]